MSIVFILLGALGATLFIINRLGLDVPPQMADIEEITSAQRSDGRIRIAA
jgi:hypothetical protein